MSEGVVASGVLLKGRLGNLVWGGSDGAMGGEVLFGWACAGFCLLHGGTDEKKETEIHSS